MELVPEELNRKNRRFIVADLKNGSRFERLEDNFVFLEHDALPEVMIYELPK